MFTWNYRLVNMPSANGGEDFLVLCEVHYEKNRPNGYVPVNGVSGESLEGITQDFKFMQQALTRPVLHEDEVGRWDFQKNEPVGDE